MAGTGAVSFGPRTVRIGIEGVGLYGVLAKVTIWQSESAVSQCIGWSGGQHGGWRALSGTAVVQQLTPCGTDQVQVGGHKVGDEVA